MALADGLAAYTLTDNTDRRFVYAELYRLITNETLSTWHFRTEQELLSHVLANV